MPEPELFINGDKVRHWTLSEQKQFIKLHQTSWQLPSGIITPGQIGTCFQFAWKQIQHPLFCRLVLVSATYACYMLQQTSMLCSIDAIFRGHAAGMSTM